MQVLWPVCRKLIPGRPFQWEQDLVTMVVTPLLR